MPINAKSQKANSSVIQRLETEIENALTLAALIVANCRPSFVGPEMTALVDDWIALFMQEDGPLKRLRATWPVLVNESFQESAAGRAAFDTWERIAAKVQGLSLSYVAQGMNRFDLRGRLSPIDKPVLLISGERDRLFSPAQSHEISQEITGSRHVMIQGAGHLSCLDSADQFNRILLEFLAAHFPVM